jgi:dihydroorotase
MNRLLVSNGLILDPVTQSVKTSNVYIADGNIIAIDHEPDGFEADQTIDATGLIISPGLVDLCARLREPGLEFKADIRSEVTAAASAGITTLCCPPDTDPVIDEPSVVELIHRKAANAGQTHVVTLGALTRGLEGRLLSEMATLKAAGCVGVSNSRRPVANTLILRRAYSYAASFGITVFIEPDEHWLSAGGCAHDGKVATRLGLQGIPVSAETVAISRALELILETGARAHFGRLSSAHGVELIRRAKEQGMAITADVSAHQLFLSEMDINSFNSMCHVLPPLRSQRDMEALRQAVRDGVIDAICSDHQPHEPDAKQAPFASTEPGISSLETLLALTLRLVHEQVVPTYSALSLLSTRPATILGIDAGVLAANRPADICIYDPEQDWQLDTSTMLSRGKNTPFEGWNFQGKVRHTIIDGRLVHTS